MTRIKLPDYIKELQIPISAAKIVLKTGSVYRTLMRLQTTRDSSLMIDVGSYFTKGNWRIGHYLVPAGRETHDTVSMIKKSIVKSKNIGPKFTYHTSGLVTTGRTGSLKGARIRTTPLFEANGHFFTLMAKGFEMFKEEKLRTSKYLYLSPDLPKDTENLKIVGRFGSLDDFVTKKGDQYINKRTVTNRKIRFIKEMQGEKIEVFLFRLILESGNNRVEKWVQIECWPDSKFNTKNPKPAVALLTGWKQKKAMDLNSPVKLLGILGG